MSDRRELLRVLRVETPCQADWEGMKVGGNTRYCSYCSKHVHDLSAMTLSDVEALVCQAAGPMCVRYSVNRRGELLTLDYRRPTFGKRRRGLIGLIVGAATVATALAAWIFTERTSRTMGAMCDPSTMQPPTTAPPTPAPADAGDTDAG